MSQGTFRNLSKIIFVLSFAIFFLGAPTSFVFAGSGNAACVGGDYSCEYPAKKQPNINSSATVQCMQKKPCQDTAAGAITNGFCKSDGVCSAETTALKDDKQQKIQQVSKDALDGATPKTQGRLGDSPSTDAEPGSPLNNGTTQSTVDLKGDYNPPPESTANNFPKAGSSPDVTADPGPNTPLKPGTGETTIEKAVDGNPSKGFSRWANLVGDIFSMPIFGGGGSGFGGGSMDGGFFGDSSGGLGGGSFYSGTTGFTSGGGVPVGQSGQLPGYGKAGADSFVTGPCLNGSCIAKNGIPAGVAQNPVVPQQSSIASLMEQGKQAIANGFPSFPQNAFESFKIPEIAQLSNQGNSSAFLTDVPGTSLSFPQSDVFGNTVLAENGLVQSDASLIPRTGDGGDISQKAADYNAGIDKINQDVAATRKEFLASHPGCNASDACVQELYRKISEVQNKGFSDPNLGDPLSTVVDEANKQNIHDSAAQAGRSSSEYLLSKYGVTPAQVQQGVTETGSIGPRSENTNPVPGITVSTENPTGQSAPGAVSADQFNVTAENQPTIFEAAQKTAGDGFQSLKENASNAFENVKSGVRYAYNEYTPFGSPTANGNQIANDANISPSILDANVGNSPLAPGSLFTESDLQAARGADQILGRTSQGGSTLSESPQNPNFSAEPKLTDVAGIQVDKALTGKEITGSSFAEASGIICKDRGCDAGFTAKALGGSAAQESNWNPNNSTGSFEGIGQLNDSETGRATRSLEKLAAAPNYLTEQDRNTVLGVVDDIKASEAAGKNPNNDPRLGAWLMTARQADLSGLGKNVSGIDAANEFAAGDAKTGAAVIQLGQLAPSALTGPDGFDPDRALTSNERWALRVNSLPSISNGDTVGDAISKIENSPIYSKHFDQGIAWTTAYAPDTSAVPENIASSIDRSGSSLNGSRAASIPSDIANTPWNSEAPIVAYDPSLSPNEVQANGAEEFVSKRMSAPEMAASGAKNQEFANISSGDFAVRGVTATSPVTTDTQTRQEFILNGEKAPSVQETDSRNEVANLAAGETQGNNQNPAAATGVPFAQKNVALMPHTYRYDSNTGEIVETTNPLTLSEGKPVNFSNAEPPTVNTVKPGYYVKGPLWQFSGQDQIFVGSTPEIDSPAGPSGSPSGPAAFGNLPAVPVGQVEMSSLEPINSPLGNSNAIAEYPSPYQLNKPAILQGGNVNVAQNGGTGQSLTDFGGAPDWSRRSFGPNLSASAESPKGPDGLQNFNVAQESSVLAYNRARGATLEGDSAQNGGTLNGAYRLDYVASESQFAKSAFGPSLAVASQPASQPLPSDVLRGDRIGPDANGFVSAQKSVGPAGLPGNGQFGSQLPSQQVAGTPRVAAGNFNGTYLIAADRSLSDPSTLERRLSFVDANKFSAPDSAPNSVVANRDAAPLWKLGSFTSPIGGMAVDVPRTPGLTGSQSGEAVRIGSAQNGGSVNGYIAQAVNQQGFTSETHPALPVFNPAAGVAVANARPEGTSQNSFQPANSPETKVAQLPEITVVQAQSTQTQHAPAVFANPQNPAVKVVGVDKNIRPAAIPAILDASKNPAPVHVAANIPPRTPPSTVQASMFGNMNFGSLLSGLTGALSSLFGSGSKSASPSQPAAPKGKPIISVVVNPSVVEKGKGTTLAWGGVNWSDEASTRCGIFGPNGKIFEGGINGKTTTSPLTHTSEFAIACVGLKAHDSALQRIVVQVSGDSGVPTKAVISGQFSGAQDSTGISAATNGTAQNTSPQQTGSVSTGGVTPIPQSPNESCNPNSPNFVACLEAQMSPSDKLY